MSEAAAPLLAVEGLTVCFRDAEGGSLAVVEDVSFAIERGETLGLVGESGCGKSVTAMSVLRLLPSPPSLLAGGSIRFEGRELTRLPPRALREVRGDAIGMVFQEPMTSLNPTFTVGWQIAEALRLHRGLGRRAAAAETVALLRQVGVGSPELRRRLYPHQLSGGLRQRAMIAMALACRPRLLIADEPTTALDVTIQAQILALLADLQRDLGMGMLLITHDLGVVAQVCRRVCVMYAGRIVERAPAAALFRQPRHPYTAGLLASRPRLARPQECLPAIAGQVPPPGARGVGCAFAERCPRRLPRCAAERPPLDADRAAPDRAAACWNPVP